MTPNTPATSSYDVTDFAKFDAHARQLRAEAFAAFGLELRNWFTSLKFGLLARTAH